jgi:hemerythrin-like domain-containing protein
VKPTERLKEEHQGVKLMLRILKKAAERMHGGTAVPHEHLGQMAEFFRVFVDRCHHAKEEELLFPAMQEARIPEVEGLIRALREEHERGRGIAGSFADAVVRCGAGDHRAPAKIVAEARVYRDLLIAHIEKEDTVLYPMADEKLSGETQKALLDGFERIEEERIGAGTHERFHGVLRHLHSVYLKG